MAELRRAWNSASVEFDSEGSLSSFLGRDAAADCCCRRHDEVNVRDVWGRSSCALQCRAITPDL